MWSIQLLHWAFITALSTLAVFEVLLLFKLSVFIYFMDVILYPFYRLGGQDLVTTFVLILLPLITTLIYNFLSDEILRYKEEDDE
jgi:hypothetical protein